MAEQGGRDGGWMGAGPLGLLITFSLFLLFQ